MLVYQTKKELLVLLSELKSKNKTIGFVPTMGALHEGHLSLVEKALAENDYVVCSIFVNPTQFNESQDFDNYPKTLESDQQLLKEKGCQVVFIPTVDDVYENELSISVNLSGIEEIMEGAHRPGHFEGVVRVLNQFFIIINPDKAYFGLKDYQQYLVVKALCKQSGVLTKVVGCETIREESGLAKSSRNLRLSQNEVNNAASISKAFQKIKLAKNSIIELSIQIKKLDQFFDLEYLELRDGDTLETISDTSHHVHIRAFFAGKIGNVRLIDNFRIK